MNDILQNFQLADNQQQKEIITKKLLNLDKQELYNFLLFIFKHSDYPTKSFAVETLAQDTQKAFEIAEILLQNISEEFINTPKYYGAMIFKEIISKADTNKVIPLLVSAYDLEDYRDIHWAISMALATLVNNSEGNTKDVVVELIKKKISQRADIEGSLGTYLRNYTNINFF